MECICDAMLSDYDSWNDADSGVTLVLKCMMTKLSLLKSSSLTAMTMACFSVIEVH